eukprot:gene22157-biopygen13256
MTRRAHRALAKIPCPATWPSPRVHQPPPRLQKTTGGRRTQHRRSGVTRHLRRQHAAARRYSTAF